MQKAIEHFMWGYQQHFRIGLDAGTKRILNAVKPGLQPEVFLIGIRIGDDGRSKPACVEPEVHHWAPSAAFYDILKDVEAIQKSYSDYDLLHSLQIAQEIHERRLFRRAVRDAVLRRLESCSERPSDLRVFASWPVERGPFLVLTLLVVRGSVLAGVPAVTGGQIHVGRRPVHVPCSLVEAIIDQILARASEAVIQPDAGAGVGELGSSDELVRRAAIEFFSGLLRRLDEDSIIAEIGDSVFDILARLSQTPYEGSDPAGALLFADKDKSIGNPVLTLATPVPLAHARALRKLLVLTTKGYLLRCTSDAVFALIREGNRQSAQDAPTLIIRIIGRGRWEVSMTNRTLMTITDSYPSLPKPVVDEKRLTSDLRRLIPAMSESQAAIFAQVGSRLAISRHGALVVIAENAVSEAGRLRNDSLSVKPEMLTPDLSSVLTEIDGAVLCAPDGLCHAAGVILDGPAVTIGDRGRGSRFNSALRYIKSNGTASAAMVLSEDGGLDLLPKLKAAMPKDELSSRLGELERLAVSPSNPPDYEREADAIKWCEQNAFYLSAEQCDNVNAWIRVCDERRGQDSETMMRILRRPLQPDPSFDPTRDLT